MMVEQGAAADADEALHGAVRQGDAAMVRFLLDNGVENLELENFAEKTPLAVAIERGDEAIVELLRERGAREPG